ncbi:MAG: aspartate dehydrogenase [Lachnospiraceae bacterium]|nr:aspartate dehydrogenase [Lachnospiraceae bacterium]
MFGKKSNIKTDIKQYDKNNWKPVIKCSICNGEQVAGFKDIHTGRFEEIMLIRDNNDLVAFMKRYGLTDVSKEY